MKVEIVMQIDAKYTLCLFYLISLPAITPIVSISSGTLVLNGDKESPMQPIMLPEMHITLIPNLFTKAPKIGANIALTPDRREPTKDTLARVELKSVIKGSRITPNEYPNPSEILKYILLLTENFSLKSVKLQKKWKTKQNKKITKISERVAMQFF